MLPCLLAISLLTFEHGAKPDAAALARRIDQQINERLKAEHVAAAEQSDDAEFLRRLYVDLVGRIPNTSEILAFLQDQDPRKRSRLIDILLGSRQHARHFAHLWRAILIPEAETDSRIAYFIPGFEAWLQERRAQNTGFDAIVRGLVSVPIVGTQQAPQFVLRDLRRPNALAYLASKEADPAKIATSCVRVFLGVRLECAQCHDHPFDRWTQRQFWSQAAFFAGIERRGRGPFAPLVETVSRTTIPVGGKANTSPNGTTTKSVSADLLDGAATRFDARKSARSALAEWMTGRRNPYFARAIVNRVWGQLLGNGLVNPVDDFRDSNPPSHPKLLSELADAFANAEFDLTFLYRAICLSEAYQRTSRHQLDGQDRADLFAAMAIKPLSDDQFFDCVTQAVGVKPSDDSDQTATDDDSARRRVLKIFPGDQEAGHPRTSVTQALALMNGRFVHSAVTPATSSRLSATLKKFPDSAERQVESLYLATLCRYPNAAEKGLMVKYCGDGSAVERPQRLGDVFWVLLNSAEFRWNH